MVNYLYVLIYFTIIIFIITFYSISHCFINKRNCFKKTNERNTKNNKNESLNSCDSLYNEL
jgi:hypothetical protein